MECFFCEVCGVERGKSETLRLQHLFGKRHVKNSRKVAILEHSVDVRGINGDKIQVSDIYDHFSRYGRIKFVDMMHGQQKEKIPNFAFVEFDNAQSVESALHDYHEVKGRRLYVHRTRKPMPKKAMIGLQSLQNCASVHEQAQILTSMLQLTQADKDIRENLRATIESEMEQYFPRCRVHIFGSSANGFGCRNCDVDLLLQTETDSERHGEYNLNENREPSKLPTVHQVKNGDVSLEDLSKMAKTEQLQFIRKVLLELRDEYFNVFYIPALSCPIVKFISKRHFLPCDLSIGRSLPLYNTALLQLYARFDERVSPLVTILCRWAKANCYISTNSFSSYSFTLMVIFFLQTRSPPVLPSVNFLREKSEIKTMADGWDCSFCSDVMKLEPSENTQSFESLLVEFFAYYRDFDYFEHVISPLTGQCEPKGKFDPEENKDMEKFKVSSVCVQDPFETTRNCSSNVKLSTLFTIVDHFKRVVHEFRDKPEIDNSNSKLWGVSQLLEAMPQVVQEIKSNSLTFNMVMSRKMLRKLQEEFHYPDESQTTLLSQIWIRDVTDIALKVLRHVLLLEYEITNVDDNYWRSRKRKVICDFQSPPCKVGRIDGVSNIRNLSVPHSVESSIPNTVPVYRWSLCRRSLDELQNTPRFPEFEAHPNYVSDKPFLCAQVSASHNTWINRNLPTLELISTGLENVLENQRSVSLDLVRDKNPKLENVSMFLFDFYKSRKGGYTILEVKTEHHGEDKKNFKMLKFFNRFMLSIVGSQL